jgi:hypothetical protein
MRRSGLFLRRRFTSRPVGGATIGATAPPIHVAPDRKRDDRGDCAADSRRAR